MSERHRAAMVLHAHLGRERAISASNLSELLGLPERRTRELVASLINEHGVPVGSSTEKPPGYYIIVDPKELDAVCASLKSRALKILLRLSRLQKASLEKVLGQLSLEHAKQSGNGGS